MNIVIIGPPGSGKGVQCELLSKELHLPHISVGQLLRDEVNKRTMLGREAQRFMNRGHLVPTALIKKILHERLRKKDARNGYILDGCPRDEEQARVLHDDICADIVFFLHVPARIIKSRLSKRRQCATCAHIELKNKTCSECGGKLIIRDDDKPAIIQKRLVEYKKTITPILKYYKSQRSLRRIDGSQEIPKVHTQIMVQMYPVVKKSSK